MHVPNRANMGPNLQNARMGSQTHGIKTWGQHSLTKLGKPKSTRKPNHNSTTYRDSSNESQHDIMLHRIKQGPVHVGRNCQPNNEYNILSLVIFKVDKRLTTRRLRAGGQ